MAMFSIDEYPDWMDELMNDVYGLFSDENDSGFEQDVWERVNGSGCIPNIGNVQVMVLFEDMKRIITKRYSDELDDAYISENSFEQQFNYEANNMSSHFYFNDEDFTELSEIDNMAKEWIKENKNE